MHCHQRDPIILSLFVSLFAHLTYDCIHVDSAHDWNIHTQRSRCDVRQRINHILMFFKLILLLTSFGRHTIGSFFFRQFFSRFEDFSLLLYDNYDILLLNSDVTMMGSWQENTQHVTACIRTVFSWTATISQFPNGDYRSHGIAHIVLATISDSFFSQYIRLCLCPNKNAFWKALQHKINSHMIQCNTCVPAKKTKKEGEFRGKMFKLETSHRLVRKCTTLSRITLPLWWLCEWVLVKLFLSTRIEWMCVRTLLNRSQ